MNRYRLYLLGDGPNFEVTTAASFGEVVHAWRPGIQERHHLQFDESEIAVDTLAVIAIEKVPAYQPKADQ